MTGYPIYMSLGIAKSKIISRQDFISRRKLKYYLHPDHAK
jgi:hypothetical protein